MESLREYIPVWKEVFNKASTEKKKMMLGILIECVYVSKEEIKIDLNIRLREFLGHLYSETNQRGRALS